MQHGTPYRMAFPRRRLLCLAGLAATGVVATACGGGVPPSTTATPGAAQPTAAGIVAATGPSPRPNVQPTIVTQQPPAAAPQAYQEAPQLAQAVKDGKLPPVQERLPKNPLVVQPVERVGRYGGTWRNFTLGAADLAALTITIGYEQLVRWDSTFGTVLPNLAAALDISPDARAYTFRLREGHKWSDGQPFTADDILFWWEDVATDKELNPGGPPSWMRAGGKPGSVEKVDRHTVRFTFAAPHGLFLQHLATASGSVPTSLPQHYLQQFHQKYNPDVEQLARREAVEGWVRLFQLKGGSVPGTPYDARWQNKDLPTLHGWVITTPFAGNVQRVVAERNPYYFKIDPAGNQLPYLDRAVYDVVDNPEVVVLRAANGEIDLLHTNISITTPANKAVLADNRERGGYRFYETVYLNMNEVIIALNLTHKDPARRQVFANKDFRVGLSHAVNRQEIIDVVFVGQGEPWQAAPRRETPFYHERLAKQYTEHDLTRANEHLDKVLPQKDGQGFRLGPDGKRFSFVVEVVGDQATRVDTLNLVKGHWRQVGIEILVKAEDRALLYTRKDANEHDAVVWGGPGALKDALLDPRCYFPYSTESNFAQAWAIWYSPGGNPRVAPEEPPAAPKRQMQLFDQLRATADEAKQTELMRQILEVAADQFYVIGIVQPAAGYGLVRRNLRNVPERMIFGWPSQTPASTNPSQYYFES